MIFEVPMKPKAYARMRTTRGGGLYTPPEYREWRDDVAAHLAWHAQMKQPGDMLLDPISVGMEFGADAFTVEITLAKWGRRKGLRGDLDNYVKAVLDASQGVLFENDRQVVNLGARFRDW